MGEGGQSKKYVLFCIGVLIAKHLYAFIELPLAKQGNLVGKQKKGGIFFKQLLRRVLESYVT